MANSYNDQTLLDAQQAGLEQWKQDIEKAEALDSLRAHLGRYEHHDVILAYLDGMNGEEPPYDGDGKTDPANHWRRQARIDDGNRMADIP